MLQKLLSGSSALFLMRLAGAGIGFISQILLAHMLGSAELGLFYAVTSLATVVGYATSLGYSQIVYRFFARYRETARERFLGAFVSRAVFEGLVGATLAALAIFLGAYFWPGLDGYSRVVYALAGCMVIPATMMVLFSNIAGAIRKFGWCYVPDGFARPLVFLVAIVAWHQFFGRISGIDVAVMFGAILAFSTLIMVTVVMRHTPLPRMPRRSERLLAKRWRNEAWPLVLLSLYTNIFSDVSILFASPFLSKSDLAAYGICLKLTLLIGYFIQTTQQMAVPDIAEARQKKDASAMRRAARKSVMLPLVMTTAAMLGCAVLGHFILGLFGAEFTHARTALIIMVASQLVRALAGPSAHVLTLSGAQRLNASLCLAALVILIAGNALFTPLLGLEGAAIAVLLSYGGWLVATAIAISRLGEMRTDILAFIKPLRARVQPST